MEDKSTICTMALRLLGEGDYAQDSNGYEACELYFIQTLHELLAAHDWSFARRRRELAKDHGGQYIIPDDCLRVIEVEGIRNWRKYGERIRPDDGCTPTGKVALIYTSSSMANRGELHRNVPEFTRAVVLRLAAYICPSLSHDFALRQRLEQEAMMVLDQAMVRDTQQDNSNDQHPLDRILNSSILD